MGNRFSSKNRWSIVRMLGADKFELNKRKRGKYSFSFSVLRLNPFK